MLATNDIERFLRVWGLNHLEGARALGVSEEVLRQFRKSGIPAERTAAWAEISSATALLERYVKLDKIPAVVRRAAQATMGMSLLDLAYLGRHSDVHTAVLRSVDLGRFQP